MRRREPRGLFRSPPVPAMKFPLVRLQSAGVATTLTLVVVVGAVGCGSNAIIANPVGPAPGDTPAQERLWAREPQGVRIEALRRDLLNLGPGVSEPEAGELAGTAVRFSEQLARADGLTRPVELHNVLVNVGLRPSGRCFEVADDLYVRLRKLDLRTFDLYRAVADKDDLWHEHNCVVATARGQPFATGMVLDGWRYAGKLRWIRVTADHHPWVRKHLKADPPSLGEPDVPRRLSTTADP